MKNARREGTKNLPQYFSKNIWLVAVLRDFSNHEFQSVVDDFTEIVSSTHSQATSHEIETMVLTYFMNGNAPIMKGKKNVCEQVAAKFEEKKYTTLVIPLTLEMNPDLASSNNNNNNNNSNNNNNNSNIIINDRNNNNNIINNHNTNDIVNNNNNNNQNRSETWTNTKTGQENNMNQEDDDLYNNMYYDVEDDELEDEFEDEDDEEDNPDD